MNATETALTPRISSSTRSVSGPIWASAIVLVAAGAQFMSAPGQSYSVATFIDPMLSTLRLDRTQYTAAYGVATLIGGIMLPLMGRLIDAFGARVMLPLVGLSLGLACGWMARVEHVVGLYIGFGLIRCLGQGTLTLISSWLVGEWFERRRGLAMGLVGLGGTLSVMIFPQLNNWLIGRHGWRNAWLVLGVAVCSLLVLPGWLLVRNRPEDMGLLPDGRGPEPEPAPQPAPESVEDSTDSGKTDDTVDIGEAFLRDSWTVLEACKSAAFWKILSVVATGAMIGTGLVFHQVSLLAEHGISRSTALTLIALQALVATVASLAFGYLTDRVPARYLLAASMLFLASAVLLLLVMPNPALVVLYSCLLGLHGGVIRSTGTVVWINYFGRLHQGAVRGMALSFTIAAAALGPLPLAIAKDTLGDYRLALGSFLAVPLAAALLVWTSRPPIKPAPDRR